MAKPRIIITRRKVYKYLLWKRYFDTGFSLTSYIKYAIALFGISSLDVKATMLIAVIYAVSCLVIGRLWYHYKLVEVDAEISNLFNPFQREVRAKLNKQR